MTPSGNPKFVPKIYGFKIFGMRGSKHELKFDTKGNPSNEEEIKQVLRKRVVNDSGINGSLITGTLTSSAVNQLSRKSEDEKMSM